MNSLCKLSLLLLLIIANCATAENLIPAEASAKIQEALPHTHVLSWASGDVNGDAYSDIAAVVEEDTPDEGQKQALIVLYGQPGGHFVVAAKSRFWSHYVTLGFNAAIDRHSVLLELECAANCSNYAQLGHYQFKERNGTLTLIGEELTIIEHPTEDDPGERGTSINYLNQSVIHWRKVGNKRKEVKLRLTDFSAIPLTKFNRWEADDSRPAAARGNLDQQFRYVPF